MKDRSKKVIVVPWDFSEQAEMALAEAMSMVDQPHQIRVINVCAPLNAVEPGVVYGNIDEHTVRNKTRERFNEFAEQHQIAGVDFVIRFGNPGREICQYAEEIDADLIVIASHGHGWLGRVLIGSVAERVVRLAPCPVLVLRGNAFSPDRSAESQSSETLQSS